jgi:hypothetical protein
MIDLFASFASLGPSAESRRDLLYSGLLAPHWIRAQRYKEMQS